MLDIRRAPAPWIAGTLAALVMIAAVLAYVFFGDQNQAKAGSRAFTNDEQAAIAAAGTETANLLTFSRAHFDADFKRALAGATGAIKTDLEGKKANTLKTITDGKFDLSAVVTHSALVGPASQKDKTSGYVVLVSLNGFRSSQANQPTPQNLQVTVVKQRSTWLVSNVCLIAVGAGC
ncbi:MAG: hypothetical protein ACR2LX_05095 [Jatrophihabitans sp.]